jgi:hypothetical protein
MHEVEDGCVQRMICRGMKWWTGCNLQAHMEGSMLAPLRGGEGGGQKSMTVSECTFLVAERVYFGESIL